MYYESLYINHSGIITSIILHLRKMLCEITFEYL